MLNDKNIEYPIKKIDYLNRVIYIDYNGYERIVKTYWTNTNNIKVKYSYFGNEVLIQAFDKNAKKILTVSNLGYDLNLNNLIISKDRIEFVVEQNKIKDWKNKIKNNKK